MKPIVDEILRDRSPAFNAIDDGRGRPSVPPQRLPAVVRSAVVGLCMVSFMTYVAMPFVTRRLSGWLYAG